MVTETSERTKLLEKRIEELEFKVRYRDEQLVDERDRSARAKKKVRQLLAKLAERDEALAELRAVLETVRSGGNAIPAEGAPAGAAAGRAVGGRSHLTSGVGQRSAIPKLRKGLTSRDLAVKERADIVAQLEGHLVQMRTNLTDGERELKELDDRRQAKEAEWKSCPEGLRTVESTQVHWQALAMIGQQIQDKRRFSAELSRKTRELDEQVTQQRALIDGFCRRGRVSSVAAASTASATEHLATPPPTAVQSGLEADKAEAESCSGASEPQDEALGAFLAAAGVTAEAILGRPLLRAAFEEQPPRLSADAIEGCSPGERREVLSLFAAWAAVAGDAPRAMHLEDLGLELNEVADLWGTLQSCGAQFEEWEMTRCPASDNAVRTLLRALATQPLRRLNLGYNALGPMGATALVGVAGSWAGSLEALSLEMNGLGDAGCQEVAGALQRGLLPQLRWLELGWNELSAACAPVLASLLTCTQAGESSVDALQLRRLGLGGNRLGSDGATSLVVAALANPSRCMELDLSMNHVGVQPVIAIADWAELCAEGVEVLVSINLEWNMVDDAKAVQRLARAVGSKKLEGDWGTSQPLVQLANNEVADLEPSAVSAVSRGLVSC